MRMGVLSWAPASLNGSMHQSFSPLFLSLAAPPMIDADFPYSEPISTNCPGGVFSAVE